MKKFLVMFEVKSEDSFGEEYFWTHGATIVVESKDPQRAYIKARNLYKKELRKYVMREFLDGFVDDCRVRVQEIKEGDGIIF